ncbi:unnamed protein product [Cuscuta campestris]|uniref:Protein TIC 20 n=2 Tax=Cuscuta sect. Cleistogrammica TaxID=1824901 RepID=A0A484LV40_9ASTE|nr:hypothetical protein DM860_014113 [Cuscuta australis]VFQ80069.1 unnamed protein product [Cuscuta campestris]
MASATLLRLSLPPFAATVCLPPHQHRRRLLPRPLTPNSPNLFQTRSPPKPQRAGSPISASYGPTPATDRLISAAAYFLPLFNGLQYGRFLLAQYPTLAIPFDPILPILSLYRSVPFASFVSFFAIYLGIVRNQRFSHYARFNSLQALVLDILLVVPLLVQRIFAPGRAGIGLKITIWMYNGLFVFVVGCFLYGLLASVFGKTPYFPLVTDAAKHQM